MWFSRFSCRFSDAIFFPICWVLYESSRVQDFIRFLLFLFIPLASLAQKVAFFHFISGDAEGNVRSWGDGWHDEPCSWSTGFTSLCHGAFSSCLHEKLFSPLVPYTFSIPLKPAEKNSYENVEEADTLRSLARLSCTKKSFNIFQHLNNNYSGK